MERPCVKTIRLSPTNAAWLAGLVDGEGNFQCRRDPAGQNGNAVVQHAPRLIIMMSDALPILHVSELTGIPPRSINHRPVGWPDKWRSTSRWVAQNKRMYEIVEIIFPFLVLKRPEAQVAWNLYRLRYDARPGEKTPPAVAEQRDRLCAILRDLNQRRTRDVPLDLLAPTKH